LRASNSSAKEIEILSHKFNLCATNAPKESTHPNTLVQESIFTPVKKMIFYIDSRIGLNIGGTQSFDFLY